MNEQIVCDVRTPRAKKARVAGVLDNKAVRYLLWLCVAITIGGWLLLVMIQKSATGNILLMFVGLPAVLLGWYLGELRNLDRLTDLENVTDMSAVVDRKVLAHIHSGLTPKQLAKIVAGQLGGFFYANRYAIDGAFLEQISSEVEHDMQVVWQRALQLARDNNCYTVDSAVLAAALVLAVPDHDTLLAQMQLSGEDITAGVTWFEHLQKVIAYHTARRSYGGIGRDLSFGWAPLLSRVGFNITASIQHGGLLRRAVGSHELVLAQALHVLDQPGRRNVCLVGEVGVGKTTLAYALAQKLVEEPKLIPSSLRYRQLVSLDAANLIANAKGRGQLEELLIRVFNEAIAAKNVILFLDNAQLFLRDGTGAVDLSSILLPVVEGGALRLILSMTDQEWLRLSQANPGLAQLLNRVMVKPTDAAETMQIIEDQVLLLEAKNKVVYMRQSLQEAYKLADRFIHEQAFPGKAIKLLEAAAGFPEQQHFVTARSVQQAVEKTFDVRVQTASSFEERDTLLNLEQKIHERMINQSRAVKLVSDALRRARAGVRNEQKPIGTFLFLGPTGVGKTELSKSLAAVYFGGEVRLVRVDLNEYSQPTDTTRLLATGAADPYSLCAQIAKQPFSVVLLDEIEKAHPNVLNLLLQMLDEGVLRDTENKPVSFRDAIIIATSNAGAERIREHIQRGEQLEQFEQAFVDELISSGAFRPEFLNRFDEIVLFRPLTQGELMQLVDLLVAALNKTLAARKVTVALTDQAKQLLVQTGYDPRLGARPLRRVVQRAVENIVAQRLLQANFTPGQTITLDAPELQATLQDRRA
jgi:ATP-dependent Clp protease ATP-binding subunit ClpC